MSITRISSFILCSLFVLSFWASSSLAQDNSHWSRQFPKPAGSTKMTGATGMSDGNGAPNIEVAKWYKGKLYMAGNWKCGLDGLNLTKRDVNVDWRMWSWHPEEGYRPIAWQHSAKGGNGPVGVINDFVFLPDGRLVTVGEFLKIDNLHGHSYHRINGIAVYNPKEPTANRWQPLVKSVQHNGPRGGLKTIAYDPQGNDLWVGGSFSGFRMDESRRDQWCYGVQRYNLDDKRWYIIPPGLRGGTGAHKIKVDTSTKPSTIYMAGRFSHTGGDGEAARDNGTDRYTEGFCAWRADVGWITFPKNHIDGTLHKQGVLQRAADFTFFDSVNILDFLVDGKDIWIVGAFSEGKTGDGKPLRGIAKWDDSLQAWVDPTGKGGFGREPYSIAKTDDGKIYVAGSFGGSKSGKFYDGFKNSDPAHMVAIYDPAANTWGTLGDGLGGVNMPVSRLMTVGNDVFIFGTFKHVGRDTKSGFESYYIARWNEHVDFTKETPAVADSAEPYNIVEPATDAPMVTEGLEHWSRNFPAPPRQSGGKTKQAANTGMDNGAGSPNIKTMQWHNGTLYFGGSWEVMMNERWFVWSYNPQTGYAPLAWTKKGKSEGFAATPEGLKFNDNKMYVYGASESWKGIAIYDPAAKTWSKFTGTYNGKQIIGNGAQGNPAINDVAWDSKTGDMYLVGSCGENIRYEKDHPGGTVPSAVLRVDKEMVYHPMGLMLLPETPKAENIIQCIYLDETKSPADIYIGGSFGFWGSDSNHKHLAYNVAKWNHEAQDWRAIGKGNFWRIGMHDKRTFPEGLPGLKGHPIYGYPTFLRELWPRVRALTMDKQGNLYAGGAVGILDDNPDINKRDEHYGLVKYDPKQDKWIGATNSRGVSRDVFQMSWIDDTRLLVSGGFLYSEDFRLLNNVAVLDTATGELQPLAGGLHKGNDAHVVSSDVIHTISDDGYWFAGNFKYAGVGPKSRSQAPIASNFIAHYNPKANLDPNGSMTIVPPAPVQPTKGQSSENREIVLTAENIPEGGKVIWYQFAYNKVKKLGEGQSYTAKIRLRPEEKSITFYAAVKTAAGTEGGKIPVIVPVFGK